MLHPHYCAVRNKLSPHNKTLFSSIILDTCKFFFKTYSNVRKKIN